MISMIVVARNSEALIEKKIKNTLAQDYPGKKLDLIFFSDGSSDRTFEIISSYRDQGVRGFSSPEHNGKNHGLNFCAQKAAGDILVFSDADAILADDALQMLARHFIDDAIGGVCGQRLIAGESSGLKGGQNRYISLDSHIKRIETSCGSISSNDGKLYGIRRELFQPVAQGVSDDLFVALSVVKKGKRFIFDPGAIAFIRLPSRNTVHELERRRRIVTGSLKAMFIHRTIFNPLNHGFFSFQLFINKIIRRAVPFFLAALWMGSFFLYPVSSYFTLFFILQTCGYLLVAFHPLLEKTRVPRSFLRFTGTGFYFCIGNLGTFWGVVDFLSGRTVTLWEPVKDDRFLRPAPEAVSGVSRQNILVLDLSKRFGGASARLIELLKVFPGHGISVAGLADSPVIRQAGAAGIRTFVLGGSKFSPLIVFSLIRIIKDNRIKVIDTQNIQSKIWGTLAALGTNTALVSTLNSWYEAEHGKSVKGKIYQFIEHLTSYRTHLYIAVSDNICRRLLSSGIERDRIVHIPNAVNPNLVGIAGGRIQVRSDFNLPLDAFVCCAVGRLVKAKGFVHLVDAFSRIRNPRICCIIIGGGHLKRELEQRIRHNGLGNRIVLAGHRDRNQVLAMVRDSDLFLMPSISEGTPLVILEAALLTRPIIATRVGGIPEMLCHNVNAVLIPAGDDQALAGAICHLAAHPEAAGKLGRRAFEHVRQHFNITEQVQRTQVAYQIAVKNQLKG